MDELSYQILKAANNTCKHAVIYNIRLNEPSLLNDFTEDDRRRITQQFLGCETIKSNETLYWLSEKGKTLLQDEESKRSIKEIPAINFNEHNYNAPITQIVGNKNKVAGGDIIENDSTLTDKKILGINKKMLYWTIGIGILLIAI